MLSSVTVLSVGLSVCPLVTNVYFAKTAESMEMPFGVVGQLRLRYDVVNGETTSLWRGIFVGWAAQCNGREGDAASSQII